jgi:quinol monooxygenase YgiN
MTETTDIAKFQARTEKAIRLLAFFKARPGKSKQLEQVLLSLVDQTRSEPGNIAYVLHRSTDDENLLFFDEVWADMESIDIHADKPYIQQLPAKISDLVSEPMRIETYTEVRAAK